MQVVLLLVESVCGAVVLARLATPGREGAKVLQQSPTSQTALARTLVPVKTTARVQKTPQTVHQTIDQVARAMAAGMSVAHHIVRLPVPQLRHHLQHRLRPGALLAPRAEGRHPLAELGGGGGAVHLPHAVMQLAGVAAAVPDLQKAVQETQHRQIVENRARKALRVAHQPSVLTVCGEYWGFTARDSAANWP